MTNIYSLIGKSSRTVNQALQELGDAAQPGYLMYQVQNELLANGEYSVSTKNMDALKKIPQFLGQIAARENNDIRKPIGDIGEMTSSLAASALTAEVIKEVEEQLGKVAGVTISRENVGAKQIEDYHMQTDNRFSVAIKLANGKTVTTELNISDKASKKQLTHFERKSTTGDAFFSRSTVAELVKPTSPIEEGLSEDTYYNVISYHRAGKKRWTHMTAEGAAGEALKNYFGYKLLVRMFITSQKFERVNFTVMGNKIIPEAKVLSQLQSFKEIKKNAKKYQASVENYKLLKGSRKIAASEAKSAVKSREEAQEVIDKMPVAIKTSISF